MAGDGKDSVRAEAQSLLGLAMAHVVAPNVLWGRLTQAFSHKNGRVREEVMSCLVNALTRCVLITIISIGEGVGKGLKVAPNVLLGRLTQVFSHKNGRVREEVMSCLVNALTR